jgi:hypothetical protein
MTTLTMLNLGIKLAARVKVIIHSLEYSCWCAIASQQFLRPWYDADIS